MKSMSKLNSESQFKLKSLIFFNLILVLIISSSGRFTFAQTKQSQLQCRSKAKEIAKTAFDQCIELAKGDEAENIRKEFRMKFEKMKAYYVQKLKKVTSRMKKDSKNGPIPAATEPSTAAASPKSSSSLPPKVQTEIPVSNESKTETFATPAPVNTQASETDDSNDKTIVTNNINSTMASKSSSSEINDEPSIRLKGTPQPEETLSQSPSVSDENPSFQPSSEKLETEPDSTI
jgi:hypothetical protein